MSTARLFCEDSDGLFPSLMRRDINSLFSRMASFSRRLCGREMAHALVKKKGKAKDEFYGKLILDLGNKVHSSVEQGTAAMDKLVEKLGNVKDKVECKKLKKKLEEARFSNTFLRMQNERDKVDAAIAAERAIHTNVGNDASGSRPVRGQDAAPAARKCAFDGFMKCNHTAFRGTKGAIELLRYFEKTESVFGINECAEGKKRFNELALMCPRMVKPERVNVDAYIWGLTNNIKGEVTSSRPANLNEAVRMAHKLMDQKAQARDERILDGKKKKWESFQNENSSGKDVEPKGPNVVIGTFLLNNRYDFVLFDSSSDRSFVDTRFSSMLDIDPVKIGASYEVELANKRVVSTNTVLKGCTLNLVNHVFEIDLLLIELGTFDVIIGMDYLVKHDAVIVYGKRFVRIMYGNKMLIVKSDKGVSRLKVISCIKARKYVERGCHLFLAHVTEDKSKEKRMKDVPVIHDFLEVFLEELPGLPPPRQ
nr:reverse transcriptase domain-containing protein [Tanacetum cinerariifolium]